MTSLSDQLLAESGLPAEFALDLEPVLTAIREFLPGGGSGSVAGARRADGPAAPSPGTAFPGPTGRPRFSRRADVIPDGHRRRRRGQRAARHHAALRREPLGAVPPLPVPAACRADRRGGGRPAARSAWPPSEAVSSELLPPTLQETAVREETTARDRPLRHGGPSEAAVVPNTPAPSPSPAVTEAHGHRDADRRGDRHRRPRRRPRRPRPPRPPPSRRRRARPTTRVSARTPSTSPTGSPMADETSAAPSPGPGPSGPTR